MAARAKCALHPSSLGHHRLVRWVSARAPAVGLFIWLAVAGCTDDRDQDIGSPAPPKPAVTTTTTSILGMAPTRDFGIDLSSAHGRVVVPAYTSERAVGFFFASEGIAPGPLVLVFDTFAVEPDCLVKALLTVNLASNPPDAADPPLTVYAGRPAIAALPTGERVSDLLLDNKPKGVFAFSDDIATANVTELLRTWLEGTFPTQGRRVDDSDPLVLVVQPATATAPKTTMIRTLTSGPETAPSLQLHTACQRHA